MKVDRLVRRLMNCSRVCKPSGTARKVGDYSASWKKRRDILTKPPMLSRRHGLTMSTWGRTRPASEPEFLLPNESSANRRHVSGAAGPAGSPAAPAEGPNTARSQGTAAPMATQSPALAAPSPGGMASPEATHSESREESTRGRARANATPNSAHRHREETTDESPAEGKATPRERTSSHRTGEEATEPGATARSHHRTSEEATEPGPTPRSHRHTGEESAKPGTTPRSTPERE
jgi:hypothetical protein